MARWRGGGVGVFKPNRAMEFTDGGSFGVAALLYKNKRDATLVAVTNCSAWVLLRVEYHGLIVKEVKRQQTHFEGFLRKVSV